MTVFLTEQAKHSYKIIAIVPAAGIGSRMQAEKPKQYLSIAGKTILEHTVNVLLNHSEIAQVIVVVAPQDSYIEQLNLEKHAKIRFVQGGKTRAESVLNGLNSIMEPENTRVLVHDAARPCLTHTDLDRLLSIDDEQGAILAMPAVDTVKQANAQQNIAKTLDRDLIWLAQTPQYFQANLLKQALQQAEQQGLQVTDEASAMELAGFRPHLVVGRRDNIKITHPEDLALAQFYLSLQGK